MTKATDSKPTINDVARLAGVSKKTVSRVINRSPLLNQATREKVEAVIADCAAHGVETLHLEVRSNNPATLFYTRHGFAKCGERRNYYKGADGQHYDAHTYRRSIG